MKFFIDFNEVYCLEVFFGNDSGIFEDFCCLDSFFVFRVISFFMFYEVVYEVGVLERM